MMRVKLFQATDDVEFLTNSVNDWIKAHPGIEIRDIKHKVTGRMDTTTVVMITYFP